MATRKQQQPDEDDLQQAISLLQEDSFTGESINPALENLYSELGVGEDGDAMVYVTMLNCDGTGKEAQVWRGKPEDYDLESIAKEFGTSEYRVKIYVRTSQGSRAIKGNKVFFWKLTKEQEKARLQVDAPAPAFSPMDIARMISEGIRAAMPAPSVVPQVDPFEQMERMARITQMMRPSQPEYAPQQVNQLGQLRDMAELLQTLRGDTDDAPRATGANGNDLLLTAITKFAPLLGSILTQGGGQMAGMPPQPAPQAQPYPQLQSDPAPAKTAPAQQPTNEAEEMSLKLKMGLSWMIGQCDGGGAPETYAEVVLDSVPKEAVDALLTSPDPLGYLAQFEPRVKTEPYMTWFNNLIKAIKEFNAEPFEGSAAP